MELTGVPGEDLRLDLFKRRSDKGNWSSHDGVYLELVSKQLDYRHVLTLIQPGEEKTCEEECSDGFEIEATFKIPQLPTEERQTLLGTFSGGVQYPSPVGDQIWYASIDARLLLTVVAPGEGTTSGSNERSRAWRLLRIVMALDLAIGAPIVAFVYLIGRYVDVQRPRNSPLALFATPGDRIKLKLLERTSYGGAWGSRSGTWLKLLDPVTGESISSSVIPTKPLYTKTGPEATETMFSVTGSFWAPYHRTRNREFPWPIVLTGKLSGYIDCLHPHGKHQKTAEFVNARVTLSVDPKSVTSSKHGLRTWSIFWAACALDAAVVALLISLLVNN